MVPEDAKATLSKGLLSLRSESSEERVTGPQTLNSIQVMWPGGELQTYPHLMLQPTEAVAVVTPADGGG